MVTYEKALLLGVAPILNEDGQIVDVPEQDVYFFDGINRIYANDVLHVHGTAYFMGNQDLLTDNLVSKAYITCNKAVVQNPKILEIILHKTDIIIKVRDLVIACEMNKQSFGTGLLNLAGLNMSSVDQLVKVEIDLTKLRLTLDEMYESMITSINNIMLDVNKRNKLRLEMLQAVLWVYKETKDSRYINIIKQIANKTQSKNVNTFKKFKRERLFESIFTETGIRVH